MFLTVHRPYVSLWVKLQNLQLESGRKAGHPICVISRQALFGCKFLALSSVYAPPERIRVRSETRTSSDKVMPRPCEECIGCGLLKRQASVGGILFAAPRRGGIALLDLVNEVIPQQMSGSHGCCGAARIFPPASPIDGDAPGTHPFRT
jgi:hypothetical protein